MTIAAAYLTSEGVVLGADSTTTVKHSSGDVVQLLNHAQKVFEIGEGGRFGLCAFGDGKAGDLSHRTVAALAGDRVDNDTTVQGVAELVAHCVAEESSTLPDGFSAGYYIGGRDPDRRPRCSLLRLACRDDGGIEANRQDLTVGQANFSGAPDYFSRVFLGHAQCFDSALLTQLRNKYGADDLPADFEKFAEAFGEAKKDFVSEGFTDLPIREAIDYVHTFLQVTVKAFKLRYGPAPCGGPLEIGYITTDRSFRWVRHKSPDSAIDESVSYYEP